MKFKEIITKITELCKRAGVKTLAAICAVTVIGGVVVLNFILSGSTDDKPANKLKLDLSQASADVSGENQPEDESTLLKADENADYFATISLQRKQARDEAIQVLLTVTESNDAIAEAKEDALGDIERLASEIEMEANIESLVMSKGFEACVAVISDDKCSVIVNSNGLLPGECAQISEIVYEQAGIIPENLKIIEKSTEN